MRLIIAEKHSVGQAIAQALGGHAEKHDGYIQVGDDLVTWAQGHLVDLAAPDEYQGHDWGRWSLDTLPIDPTPDWQWKVSREKGADRQYKIVAGLMRRDDTDSLVNACDPDREGEAIFRRIVAHAGVSKPMRRLWVASLEEDAIRAALESMRDETDYQGLADAAMIRAQADWLIGMNASRAYSLVYNARFTVGRVQTPTLAMIVDRDRDIAGHVARPYWKVVAPMGGWKLAGERLDKREDAETLLRIVNSDDFAFSIFKAERQQQHDAPPHLYDLTGLQKDMSRLHGLTAARTLTALQSLYEKRLTTYPRTDSQYITHDDLDTLRGLAEGDRLVAGFIEPSAKPERPRLGLTVNDAKVAGHTAILPTMQADKAALDELGDDERLVLVRVARRMWEAVGDDYVHDVTNVVANIDPHWCEKHPDEGRLLSEGECRFTSRSDQPVALGWRAVEHAAPQEDQGEEDETAGNIIPANLAARIPADAQTAVRQDHVQTKRNTESFGDCPRCGKPVVKTGKVFQCSTNRREKQPDGTWNTTEGCGWRAWTTIAGKTITDMTMRRLLDGRKVSLKGFTSRKGSTFDAALLIDKDKGIAFDFGNNNKERKKK